MKKINWTVIIIVLILVLGGAYYFTSKKGGPPVDNRKALVSLADLALSLSSDDSITRSLVSADKKFYMAFFKTELGKGYFYARHGSCCPCSPGDMNCCECLGGSGFGGPDGDFSLAELRGLDNHGSVFMLTANRVVQQAPALKLEEQTVGGMKIFLIPPGTTIGKYSVKFSGTRPIEMVIDILNSDGSFKVLSYQ